MKLIITLVFVTLLAGCTATGPKLVMTQRCEQFEQAFADALQLRGEVVNRRYIMGLEGSGAPPRAKEMVIRLANSSDLSMIMVEEYGAQIKEVYGRLYDGARCPLGVAK